MWHNKEAVLSLISMPITAGARWASWSLQVSLPSQESMVLIATVDVPFQLWEHHRKLKMTKEEVRQENKETEGDPHVGGRIRAQQRQWQENA